MSCRRPSSCATRPLCKAARSLKLPPPKLTRTTGSASTSRTGRGTCSASSPSTPLSACPETDSSPNRRAATGSNVPDADRQPALGQGRCLTPNPQPSTPQCSPARPAPPSISPSPASARVGKSSMSRAPTRLGTAHSRRLSRTQEDVVAEPQTRGAWYRGPAVTVSALSLLVLVLCQCGPATLWNCPFFCLYRQSRYC